MEGLELGITPFEKAQIGRAKSQLMLVTHYAVKELITSIDECDAQIAKWGETVRLYNEGQNTREQLEFELKLATQALKDKKLFEEALIKVCETAADQLGLEA